MKSREELNLVMINVLWFNAQFVLELSNSRMLDARKFGVVKGFFYLIWEHPMKWMRATGICPNSWKSNLAGSAFCEEHFVLVVEQKERKGSMEDSARLKRSKSMGHLLGNTCSSGVEEVVVLIDGNKHVGLHHVFLIHVDAILCRRKASTRKTMP